MMSNLSFSQSSFPAYNDTEMDKDSFEFGNKIANAIQWEWFNREGNTCRFYNNWIEFNRRRSYASANQDTSKYKNLISVNGDMSYLNLDYTPLAIGPKFVNIIVNGMVERGFKINAHSQDPLSSQTRLKLFQEIEADFYAKDFLNSTQEQFGIDAFNFDPNDLPETDEELELYKQLNDKVAIEIAQEVAIETIFEDNRYVEETERRVLTDIVVDGLGIVKHEFHVHNGISLSRVDGANFVYSYTEDPYFKDCFYHGEIKTVHKSELYKINPDLTKEEVDKMASMSYLLNDYFPIIRKYNLYQKDSVTLLYFDYKTTRTQKKKIKKLKNGGERVVNKDSNYNGGDGENFISKNIERDVWYNGVKVLGTEFLIKWELAQNMVKPDSTSQEVISNYVMCAPEMCYGVINSTINKMIPFIDQMQLDAIKLQQVKSRIVPDGVFIDIDGINEVDLGTGGAQSPIDALNMYIQTGSLLGRSKTQDGDYNNAKVPITEIAKTASQAKITSLITSYNTGMMNIRDLIGVNEARDGSTPDPRSLVGVQKLAALSSNTATRHILDAMCSITERIAFGVSLRISDILQYSDTKEEFALKIGKYNLSILDNIKDLYLHSFGVYLELEPDELERQALNDDIQIALQSGTIDVTDARDLRNMGNVKLAFERLKLKIKKTQQELEHREDVKAQMQQAFNLQSQDKSVEVAQLKAQAEAQAKIAVENVKIQGELTVLDREVESKSALMAQEFQYNMELSGMDAKAISDKVKLIEDNKTLRQDRANSQQSQMITQRKKDLNPIDFESSNDSIGDLDLESFDPR